MKERKNNGKKITVILVAAFIVTSMVVSIFAIVVDNQSQSIPNYNKQSFIATDYGYKTKIGGAYMDFYYYPGELERIPLGVDVATLLRDSSGIAFVFNPADNISDNLQYIDVIRYDLIQQIDNPVFFGITQESENYSLPIVGCDNATQGFPFIIINSSADTGFYVSPDNPNCIIMNARLRELLAAKDRFIYTYYGIMI